jgi:hypothetical protein
MKMILQTKNKTGMFKKGIQWVAVTSAGKKDWIQVGKVNKTFGKSFIEMNKTYPAWGDNNTAKEMKKAYCYVLKKKPTKKAAKKADPVRAAMLKRVQKLYVRTRGKCMQSVNKRAIDKKFQIPAGKKTNVEQCSQACNSNPACSYFQFNRSKRDLTCTLFMKSPTFDIKGHTKIPYYKPETKHCWVRKLKQLIQSKQLLLQSMLSKQPQPLKLQFQYKSQKEKKLVHHI